jgi:hypothetical protein
MDVPGAPEVVAGDLGCVGGVVQADSQVSYEEKPYNGENKEFETFHRLSVQCAPRLSLVFTILVPGY